MNIRHYLHANPELSGHEEKTCNFIYNFLSNLNPDYLESHIGNCYGVIAAFYGQNKGTNVAFRADIDALPINDEINYPYKSNIANIGHKCGHDGHTSILLKVAEIISQKRPKNGNIILIFQPEEETGYGAQKIIDSNILDQLHIDVILGLHNLPGYEEGTIIINKGTFAAASSGFIATLTGKPTHAAHPENGINPGLAIADIIYYFDQINKSHKSIYNFRQATLIYTKIGQIAFGTSAGNAKIMTTLRAFSNKEMQSLINDTIDNLTNICQKYQLGFEYSFQDKFAAVENNKKYVDLIRKTAIDNNYKLLELYEPFRWSEDFSNYLKKYKGAFFGVGSGINHPELHSPYYDFPDNIILSTAEFEVKLATLIMQNP